MAKKKPKTSDPKPSDTASARPRGGRGGRGAWKVMDRSSTIAAGLLAREVSVVVWRGLTGRKPPVAGRHPDVDTREAVAWAVVGGALVELVKLGVRRWTAGYWVRSTGSLPPGMKPIKPSVAGATGLDATEPAPVREPARRRRGASQ